MLNMQSGATLRLIGRMMTAISILDLARINEGSNVRIALDNARDLAQHAEGWGYERIWFAEHHNFSGIASSATSLVISHVAAGTKKMRVGSGGIMLPNHSPLVIAEQFGTLAHLYPGRIDLGLGRAPGTDRTTMRALRRNMSAAENFPHDVVELQSFLSDESKSEVKAIPGLGTRVPLWILGSSTFGAKLAAELGLPYAFASHFAPQQLFTALEVYRQNFRPSEQLKKPHVMIGVNVIAADTDEEARRLWTTQQMSFVDHISGNIRLSQPPIDDIETYWGGPVKNHVMNMLSCSVVGAPKTINTGLKQLIKETQADELMVVSDIYDHSARLHSYEIISNESS